MDNKGTALITGASRGIGRAIALRLAPHYELVLISRQSADDMKDLPGKHFAGDVGDIDFVKHVFGELDSLEVLINNAGIAHIGLLQDTTPEKWEELIRTNLSSVFYTCREAIPLMLKHHRGRIINISSVWGEAGAACEAAYSATKGGVNALTRALAKELAPSNIQVNALSCGLIDTDMNSTLSEEDKEALIKEIPAGRIGTPEDIAGIVYGLLNSGDYLTGQIIRADGGWI